MKSTQEQAFSMRIFYAPTPELIKKAAERDYTHVVIHSFGHVKRTPEGFAVENMGDKKELNDDIPLFFNMYPELAKERRAVGEKEIIAVQNRINEKIKLASELGLKSIVASYELSLPYELNRCCPEILPDAGTFCLANPEQRKFLQDKISELFEVFFDLDSYLFTAKEASHGIYYTHSCDECKALSHADKINLLTQTIIDGKNQVKKESDIIFRIWGAHFPLYFYRERTKIMWKYFGKPKKYDKIWETSSWNNYSPDKVLPEFAEQCDPSLIICTKATWQDFDFRQAANPWLGKFPRNREIVEVSYENYGNAPLREYFALTGQIDRFVKLADKLNLAGVMTLPSPFGGTEHWHHEKGKFCFVIGKGTREITMPDDDEKIPGKITDYIAAHLLLNPKADLKNLIKEYFFKNFKIEDSEVFVNLILSIEDLTDKAINCFGLSVTGPNHYCNNNSLQLESYKDHTCWACCAADGNEEKIIDILRNLDKVFMEKDNAISEAENNLVKIKKLKENEKYPENLVKFIEKAYSGFVDILKLNVLSQKIAFPLWSMEFDYLKGSEQVYNFIADCLREKEKLIFKSRISKKLAKASEIDRLYGFNGIQRYKTIKMVRPGSKCVR